MPSPDYVLLKTTLSRYIEPVKAADILNRWIEKKSLSPDNLTRTDFPVLLACLSAAAALYVPAAEKSAELVKELNALA